MLFFCGEQAASEVAVEEAPADTRSPEERLREEEEERRQRLLAVEEAARERHEKLQQDLQKEEMDLWLQNEGSVNLKEPRETAVDRYDSEKARRRKAVAAFLHTHGFVGVDSAKRTLLTTAYPIHVAAELGDVDMVRMLIREGAGVSHENSAGRTPLKVAQRKDKAGSHAGVVALLSAAAAGP